MRVIVGLDPGTTVGLAVLDLNGNLLAVTSRRDMGKNEIVNFITRFGQPLIVASDVNPLPKTVEKISRIVHAKPFFPKESLRITEKEGLVKDFSAIVKEEHQNDALAAAIKAWKSYRSFFLRTEEELEKMGIPEFFEDVIVKLIRGEADNIEDAATEVLNQKRKILPEIKPAIGKDIELARKLQKTLTQKDKYIEILKRQSYILNRALNKTRGDLKRLEMIKMDAGELEKMKEDMGNLKKGNELMKRLRRIEDENFIPLIEIENGEIGRLNEMIDLEDRFILTDHLETINSLNQYKIKGLLTTAEPNKKIIKDLEFPVIQIKKELIQIIEGIKAVKIEDVEKEFKKAMKTGLVEWLEKYRKRKI